MNKVCELERCTGCAACQNICSKDSIHMEYDKDGFSFPVIDQKKCIECHLCEITCPAIHPVERREFYEAYVASNNSKQVKLSSSSGGMFSALADCILDLDGVVFAARFDPTFTKVYHSIAESKEELEPFRGSKYLQSDIDLCYRAVKKYINRRQYVLFVGTPCQIAGLRAFLKTESEYLYTVDFICHGVLSKKVFSMYIEDKLVDDEKVEFFSFRDKKHGHSYLENHAVYLRTDSGREYTAKYADDLLGFGFENNLISRISCSTCQYASKERVSDITLCDYPWNITEEQRILGASGVLVNTLRGAELLSKAGHTCEMTQIDCQEMTSNQQHLRKPSIKHQNRDVFFKDLDKGFKYSAERHFCWYKPWQPRYKRVLARVRKKVKKLLRE